MFANLALLLLAFTASEAKPKTTTAAATTTGAGGGGHTWQDVDDCFATAPATCKTNCGKSAAKADVPFVNCLATGANPLHDIFVNCTTKLNLLTTPCWDVRGAGASAPPLPKSPTRGDLADCYEGCLYSQCLSLCTAPTPAAKIAQPFDDCGNDDTYSDAQKNQVDSCDAANAAKKG